MLYGTAGISWLHLQATIACGGATGTYGANEGIRRDCDRARTAIAGISSKIRRERDQEMSGPIMGQRARTRAEARHRPTREDQYDRRGLSARHCPRRRGGVERAGGRID
jgi:hypothetical protein